MKETEKGERTERREEKMAGEERGVEIEGEGKEEGEEERGGGGGKTGCVGTHR